MKSEALTFVWAVFLVGAAFMTGYNEGRVQSAIQRYDKEIKRAYNDGRTETIANMCLSILKGDKGA